MTLKVKVDDPDFQYLTRESQDVYLVQIWWFYLKHSYCADKLNFLEKSRVKMALNVKVNDTHFQ